MIVARYLSDLPNSNDSRGKEAQLIMSLKFHHAQILEEIPLEVAVQAMTRVWRSCQGGESEQANDVIHLF